MDSPKLPNLTQLSIGLLCKRVRAPYLLLDYHGSIGRLLEARRFHEQMDEGVTHKAEAGAMPSAMSSDAMDESMVNPRRELFDRFSSQVQSLQELQASLFRNANSTVLSTAQLIQSLLEKSLLRRRWVVVFIDTNDELIMRWIVFVHGDGNLYAYVYNINISRSQSREQWVDTGRDQFTEVLKDPEAMILYDPNESLSISPNQVFDMPNKLRKSDTQRQTVVDKTYPFGQWYLVATQEGLITSPAVPPSLMGSATNTTAPPNSSTTSTIPTASSERLRIRASPWTLSREYEAHVEWLRLLQAPLEPTEGSFLEGGSLQLKVPTEDLLAEVEVDIDRSLDELNVLRESDLAQWFESARVLLRVPRLRQDCVDALSLATAALVQPSFPALGAVQDDRAGTRSTATKTTIQLWKDMIGTVYDSTHYTNDRVVPLYSTTTQSTESSPLQVEHIVPQSWLHATGSLCGFEYATDDPLLCYVTTKNANEERATRPLQFGRGANIPGSFAVPLRSQQAFLAKVVAYAALTYPLVGPNSEAAMGQQSLDKYHEYHQYHQYHEYNGSGPGRKGDDPTLVAVYKELTGSKFGALGGPLGVPQYAMQWDALMRLIVQQPEPWERLLSHMCYAKHQRRNPLMHSEAVRRAVTLPTHPWNRLLRRRLRGDDFTSRAMLLTLGTH